MSKSATNLEIELDREIEAALDSIVVDGLSARQYMAVSGAFYLIERSDAAVMYPRAVQSLKNGQTTLETIRGAFYLHCKYQTDADLELLFSDNLKSKLKQFEAYVGAQLGEEMDTFVCVQDSIIEAYRKMRGEDA